MHRKRHGENCAGAHVFRVHGGDGITRGIVNGFVLQFLGYVVQSERFSQVCHVSGVLVLLVECYRRLSRRPTGYASKAEKTIKTISTRNDIAAKISLSSIFHILLGLH